MVRLIMSGAHSRSCIITNSTDYAREGKTIDYAREGKTMFSCVIGVRDTIQLSDKADTPTYLQESVCGIAVTANASLPLLINGV